MARVETESFRMNQPASQRTDRDLFLAALDQPTPELRAAFVLGACAGDAALRDRVEAMLAEHFRADGFMAMSAVGQERTVLDEDARATEGPGAVIGRYKLLQQIGEGGMGAVYMAEQEVPVRRRVALKIIKLGMDTKQVVARFEAERQALALMDHPNIARVLDGGTADTGRPYFVMELVQGVPITEFCDANKLPARERMRLFVQVCQAIQSAHQKGIIHRDIKPSNVLVTLHHGEPMPKVIDFGIAKATNQKLTEKTLFTNHATMIGTPAYMSPEQAEMSSLDVDTRTDVYALGVLLYELLTGSTPFPEKRLRSLGYGEMQRVIVDEEPERPSTRLSTMANEQKSVVAKNRGEDLASLRKLLRGDLDWVVMRCLEKDRRRRYDTPNELVADIERHLKNEPVVARPPTVSYRFQKMVRRNKLAFAAASAVTLALVAGLSVSTWQTVVARKAQRETEVARNGEQQQRLEAQSARKVAETERERAKQEAASRRVQLYAAEVNLAGETLAEDDFNRARELLARQIPAPGETNDLRGFEWRYLWQQSQSAELTTLGQHEAGVHGVRFSPDGTLLASSEINGTVKLWDNRTRKFIATLRDTTIRPMDGNDLATKALAFSPDGGRLAVGVGRDIVLWEVASHQRIAVLNAHSKRVNFLVFARGGKILASGADDDLVKLWDVNSSEPREMTALPVGFVVSCVAFSADGKTLAASGFSPPIKRWDLSNLEAPVELPPLEAKDGHTGWVLAIAFSPRTNLLISADSGGRMMAWDFASDPKEFSPRKLALPHGSSGIVNAVAFTPDGQTMLSAGSDNNITFWDLSGWGQSRKLMGHVREVFSLDVSPDGRTLASGGDDRTVKLWDISSRWREKPKMSHGEWMLAVAISRDSKLIASLSIKKLRLWDAATEELRAEHPRLQFGDGHLVFSPESNILASEDNTTGTGIIRLLKVPSFEEITNFRGGCPLFSPNGAELVYSLRDGERIGIHWRNLKTQELRVWKTEWDSVHCLAMSPDGQSIAAAKGRSVWIWHASAPDHPVEIQASGEDEKLSNQMVWDVAFSPDGHWLASADWDGSVRLWNLANPHEKVQPLKAHGGAAWAVAFSPDGRTLATGGDDATIKLWNLASLQQTATLRGHTGPVDGLAFSRDGTLLASSSGDGTARLWRAPTFQEIEDQDAKRGRQP
jgi:WD40 repeat protein/serine/threonine protein kinase